MAFNQNEAFGSSHDHNPGYSSYSSIPPSYNNPPNDDPQSYNKSPNYGPNPPYYNPPGQAPPFSAPPYQQMPPYGVPGAPPPSYVAPAPGMPPYYAQQSQVIVVGAQPVVSPVFVAHPQRVSMVGAIFVSCLVFWFCGVLFGGIAFILAMVGQSSASAGDMLGAIRLRNASYALSSVGLIVGCLVIGLTVGLIYRVGYYSPYYYYYRSYYYY